MARPWIRLYTDLPYSAKVQRLPDHLFRFLMNCWCFTGSSKDECLPAAEDIAFKLHIDPEICSAYIEHLLRQNLLIRRQGSGKIVPKNWDDRQFISDSSKDRQRKHRKKKKLSKGDGGVTSRVTLQDSDTDSDTEQKQTRTEEPDVSPAIDEQFQEYKRLFEIVGNPIPEDFANGSFCWRAWSMLDFSQRTLAVESLWEREKAGVQVLHSAHTYLSKLEYKRPLRKVAANGNSRHDQIRRAMEEA